MSDFWCHQSKKLRKTLGVLEQITSSNPFVKQAWVPGSEVRSKPPYIYDEPIAVLTLKLQDIFREFITLTDEQVFQSLHLSTLIEKCEDKANTTHDRITQYKDIMAKIETYKSMTEFQDVPLNEKDVSKIAEFVKENQ